MIVTEIKPHRWGGKPLNLPASSLCFRRKIRQSTTHKTGRAFGRARFRFSIRQEMLSVSFRSTTRLESCENGVIETDEAARFHVNRCRMRRPCGFQPRAISRLSASSKRKDNSKLTGSKFDMPETLPRCASQDRARIVFDFRTAKYPAICPSAHSQGCGPTPEHRRRFSS
jgi:hypothetical protein